MFVTKEQVDAVVGALERFSKELENSEPMIRDEIARKIYGIFLMKIVRPERRLRYRYEK